VTHVVDTHALIWFLERNRRLSMAARGALLDSGAELVIPTIVLAEIAWLYPRKRVRVDISQVRDHVAKARNCSIYPLDEEVVLRLPANLDIHDAIITATALVFRDMLGKETAVVSRDAAIKASGLVDMIW